MKNRSLILLPVVAALSAIFTITSCNDKNAKQKGYTCDLGYSNYLNLTKGDTNFIAEENTVGGLLLVLDDDSVKRTFFEMGYYRNNIYNSIYIKLDTVADLKTFNMDHIKEAHFEESEGLKRDLYQVSITFNSLSGTVASTRVNHEYYDKATGSFTAKYIPAGTIDTAVLSGTFCTDALPEYK